jgi:hypothetical protein
MKTQASKVTTKHMFQSQNLEVHKQPIEILRVNDLAVFGRIAGIQRETYNKLEKLENICKMFLTSLKTWVGTKAINPPRASV